MINKKDALTRQTSLDTIFGKFKKGISPVVATALLLVVAVVSVVGFSGWFETFSSTVFVDVETQTSNQNSLSVEAIIGNKLYLNSKENSSINSVRINNVDCNFNGSVLGLDSINVSSCISGYSGVASIVVVTGKKIIESFKYIDGSSVLVSEALSIVGYNSTFGQWIGGANGDYINSISIDSSDNVYVGGYAGSDITDDGLGAISGTYSNMNEGFIFKFNSTGGYEWGQWVGGASMDSVISISIDSSDNVYVGGYAGSDITDDGLGAISGSYSGLYEGFIFKFNSSGNYEWGQWIGGASFDGITSISIDSSNNVYVGGVVATNITDDGLGAISGTYSDNNEGFIFKFNSTGGYEWGQWVGGAGTDSVSSISFDSSDNMYVGGSSNADITDDGLGTISGNQSGESEGFIFKFNSTGGYEWGQWIGGANGDSVSSISIDSSDNMYVGGSSNADITDDGLGTISGNQSGESEGFIFKFNSTGGYEWGQWIGGANGDSVSSISIDSSDNVYVGGYSNAVSDITDDGLGAISGNHSGGYEGFIFKFEPLD
jgi:flagellin-like protein